MDTGDGGAADRRRLLEHRRWGRRRRRDIECGAQYDDLCADAWDPCTIPDEAIERAGLNVDTKESGVFGRDQFGFKICGWENQAPPESKYYVRIFVGFQTIDWISDTSRFDGLRPVQLGTRDATQFEQISATESLNCGVAYTAGSELVMSTIISDVLVDSPQYDPCTELNSLIATLGSELPS